MPRSLATLCLFAVLVGPLLCQADAADDFARSLAELAVPNVIEPADTDACDAICRATMTPDTFPGLDLDRLSTAPFDALASTPIIPIAWSPGPREPGPTLFPDVPALRRQARLQVFLF